MNISKIINHIPGVLIYRGVKLEPFGIDLYAFNQMCQSSIIVTPGDTTLNYQHN